MKTFYQPWKKGVEEEAILESTYTAGLNSARRSQITKGMTVRTGEGPKDKSVGGSIGLEESRSLL